MATERSLARPVNEQAIVKLVLDGLTSEHSKKAYGRALTDFLSWYAGQGRPPLSKGCVQAYRAELIEKKMAAASVNLRLSAIRKMASEAVDNGLLPSELANGIARVPGVKKNGVRAGHWLTLEQAQSLLRTPDISTLKGLRDRAILAIFLGAALRRSEVAGLTFSHIRQLDGRWCIADLVGKHGRLRTIPVPAWVKVAVDAWADAAKLPQEGFVFRAMRRGQKIVGDHMDSQGLHDVVMQHTKAAGLEGIAPHDLRRSWAKLAHKGGAALDQISLVLGHASLATTQAYLGVTLDLQDSPGDRLGLRL